MSYQDKYIKYKTKYNNLKMLNFYELSGGNREIDKVYYKDPAILNSNINRPESFSGPN